MIQKQSKPKRCRICSESFIPVRAIQPTCLKFDCQLAYANKVSRKSMADRLKVERKKDRERKEKIKTRSDYMKEAQASFNRFVRIRDYGRPCISCGREQISDHLTGGSWDCGHYRSVGASKATRFNLFNTAKQCKRCNRDLSGNHIEMRKGMIDRFGIERIEKIEQDNSVRKFDIEYLKRVKFIFNKRANLYTKLKLLLEE